MMVDDRVDVAARALLDRVVEGATDGSLGLDQYLKIAEDVALAHGVAVDALVERFAMGHGEAYRIELAGGGPGGP